MTLVVESSVESVLVVFIISENITRCAVALHKT